MDRVYFYIDSGHNSGSITKVFTVSANITVVLLEAVVQSNAFIGAAALRSAFLRVSVAFKGRFVDRLRRIFQWWGFCDVVDALVHLFAKNLQGNMSAGACMRCFFWILFAGFVIYFIE